MNANKENSIALFVNNLEITEVFRDKDEEEGASVINLIN